MKDEEKLTAMSVQMSMVDWLGMKGVSKVLNKSLSRVLRETLFDLLEDEVWGESPIHRRILEEEGHYFPKCEKDEDELGAIMYKRIGPISNKQADELILEVERLHSLATSLGTESEDDLTILDARTLVLMVKINTLLGTGNGDPKEYEKLICTTNISMTKETERMIKTLVGFKVYTTQSELVRRAIKNYLDRRVWVRIEPTLRCFYRR